jgi:mono/diheme cytochrome c family protein
MKAILALLLLATPTLADHCRKQNVVIQSTGAVITQFAVPVAVPVAVASPYLYQHSGAQVYGQQAKTADAQLFEEFLEFKRQREANTVKAQALPQTLVQQNCVACHTNNADAKEHFDMSKELTADQKLSAIRAVMLGKMPKAKTLDPQVRSDLIAEISGVKE